MRKYDIYDLIVQHCVEEDLIPSDPSVEVMRLKLQLQENEREDGRLAREEVREAREFEKQAALELVREKATAKKEAHELELQAACVKAAIDKEVWELEKFRRHKKKRFLKHRKKPDHF